MQVLKKEVVDQERKSDDKISKNPTHVSSATYTVNSSILISGDAHMDNRGTRNSASHQWDSGGFIIL